jgi:hypothetical protein
MQRCFVFLAFFFSACLHDRGAIRYENYRQVQSDFPIYYMGPAKDTIRIGRRYWRGRTPIPQWPVRLAASRTYSGKELIIEVDTSFMSDSPVEYLNPDGSINYDSTLNFRAYTFTIRNISDSFVWMGRTFSVYFLHLELKDRQGNWIRTGKKLSEQGICGTGEPSVYLKPGEIIISKVRCYQGPVRMEARLAFGSLGQQVYSNAFPIFLKR